MSDRPFKLPPGMAQMVASQNMQVIAEACAQLAFQLNITGNPEVMIRALVRGAVCAWQGSAWAVDDGHIPPPDKGIKLDRDGWLKVCAIEYDLAEQAWEEEKRREAADAAKLADSLLKDHKREGAGK